MESIFPTKKIQFCGLSKTILLQNENGPCPLLAIANVLLLRGALTLSQSNVTAFELIQIVADYISTRKLDNPDESSRLNFERQIQDALELLPQLLEGLDVNVKFRKLNDFEYTANLVIFDVVGVDLIHGWLVPDQHPNYEIISKYSYNQALEKIIAMKSLLQDKPAQYFTEDDNLVVRDGQALEDWVMRETPSQFTFTGVVQMHKKSREGQFAIFFRNNHFNTVFKKDSNVYQLVTDVGFSHKLAIWEKLDETTGDTQYYDANFNVNTDADSIPSFSEQSYGVQSDGERESMLLVQRLQEEESLKLARELQQQEERRARQQQQQYQQQHHPQDYNPYPVYNERRPDVRTMPNSQGNRGHGQQQQSQSQHSQQGRHSHHGHSQKKDESLADSCTIS